MRIAILGAGRVGRALGTRFRGLGHDVVHGVREPTDSRHQDLEEVALPSHAAVGADLVVVALPWEAVEPVMGSVEVGEAIVVDATNPLAENARELVSDPDRSGAELIAGWTGSRRVIKAFNTTGAANMADPDFGPTRPVMPVAGDDPDAKATVLALASDLGFDALDAGPLAGSRQLEHLALLWIRLAYPLGNGPDIAFALVRR